MNKIEELKAILPSIPDVVSDLRKESATSLCGPCPKCGGDNRFVYRTDSEKFWCRNCHEKPGDKIDFHTWINGADIAALLKQYLPDSKPVKTTSKPFEHYELGFPVEKYPYTDADGKVKYWNCRFELSDGGKTFRQCSANGLSWTVKGIKKVPYNLPKVIQAKEVFSVEGEKDVHSLSKLNLVGTCNVAGAGNWTEDLNPYFKDKEVYLIPDNDDPGRKHIEKVYQNLKGIAASIKLIELPGLPEGGDFSDWLDTYNDIDEAGERFAIMAESAIPYEPPKKISYDDIILLASDFYKLDVSERQELLYPWLKEDSNSLVSGWRGCGKTWFILGVLDAVTRGESFGPWECKKSVPCLFLDGEMTVSDDHERIKNLRLDSDRKNPLYFYSDAYANQLGLPRAHLANETWRKEMKQILLTRKVKLWVVDNLASLASGLDENKKQDWDPINSWLLELRFAGISTIMLHHVNKDGGQRGTSAREDNLDISIMLKKPHDYTPEDGARFIVHFSKARVSTSRLNLIGDNEFKLIINESGDHVWTFGSVKKATKNEILRLLDEGMTQTDIKNTLKIDKAYVSRTRKQAIKDGLLTTKDKLTQSGFTAII